MNRPRPRVLQGSCPDFRNSEVGGWPTKKKRHRSQVPFDCLSETAQKDFVDQQQRDEEAFKAGFRFQWSFKIRGP